MQIKPNKFVNKNVFVYICVMIRDLKHLYTAVSDNEVVAFNTNLKYFVESLSNIEPEARNYQYYYREFQKGSKLLFENSVGRKYVLQKVL